MTNETTGLARSIHTRLVAHAIGRWLAGSAPVPRTKFLVVIQVRDDLA